MIDLLTRFEKIYIDKEAKHSLLAQRAYSLFPNEIIFEVSGHPLQEQLGELTASQYSQSKRLLYIHPHKGHFFKRCPGFKPGLSCCNYFVLNLGLQCPMDCSYCFLQSYHNNPVTTLYSNIGDAITELEKMALENPTISCRVGTGETMDSLALDPLSNHSLHLMEFFYRNPHWYLELKTKTDFIDHLLDLPHHKNVIFSWSLNPQLLIDQEELFTAHLEERLNAAEKCVKKGFLIAFYFDPLIWFPEWRAHYEDLINQVTSRFKPEQVSQLAMGSLRIQPEQRHIMRERFAPSNWVNRAELLPSSTGKLRYPSHLRNEMFQTIYQMFKSKNSGWTISLCMETAQQWKQTYDSIPTRIEDLRPFFKPVRLQSKESKTSFETELAPLQTDH